MTIVSRKTGLTCSYVKAFMWIVIALSSFTRSIIEDIKSIEMFK